MGFLVWAQSSWHRDTSGDAVGLVVTLGILQMPRLLRLPWDEGLLVGHPRTWGAPLAPFDHEPAHQVEPFVTVPPELMPFMA